MTHKTFIKRFEISKIQLPILLSHIKKNGDPVILTEKGRGVFAIIPYTDPMLLKKKSKYGPAQ